MAQQSVHEGTLAPADVKAGAVVLKYTAERAETLTGFYVRLANCIGPAKEPVVVALRAGGEILPERVSIPVYGTPLNMFTRQNGRIFPPLDVAQEYRVALGRPLDLKPGATAALEVLSAGPMASGITAGVQREGAWPLIGMREPFRQTRVAGPVSRLAWSAREVICTGNQKTLDPLCAPQNNSGVVADGDGTLFQFTAFYSVDEWYGGGRAGSYARIYGFKKTPGAAAWTGLGLLVDVAPPLTYAGAPFAFRDLDGVPCLIYDTINGTNGYIDWTLMDNRIIRSTTRSFAGPWGPPHAIVEAFPRAGNGRQECVRIYPRRATGDYVMLWQHGEGDISIKGAILPNLRAKLTHEQVSGAPAVARNQGEGGGGFVLGDKGYFSEWQLPNLTDPTGIQRLYEFDLADPLNAEQWRVVPGSWGWNDGTNPVEDGGETADAWALSLVGDELWATSVAFSVAHGKTSVLACHVPWEKRFGNVFRYGVPRSGSYGEMAPAVEYAVGQQCSLGAEATGFGKHGSIFLFLAPSARPSPRGGIAVEISDKGARLAAYPENGAASGLTPYQAPAFREGKSFRVKLQRDGDKITGWVDGVKLGPVTIFDAAQKSMLAEPQRFKFYGWQGCRYELSGVVLNDGPEPE